MEYKFSVIKTTTIQSTENFNIEYDIVGPIAKYHKLYIRLELIRHKKDSIFTLSSIATSDNKQFELTNDLNRGILMGFFELSEQYSSVAWDVLKAKLNGEYKSYNLGNKWEDFQSQFSGWYNKSLKPKAEEYFDIFIKQSDE